MAGFTTYDSIINAYTVNETSQRILFQKTSALATNATVPITLWTGTGNPPAGSEATNGKANGRVLTSATTGAMPYTNAGSGTMHLIGAIMGAITSTSNGTLILIDRISDINLNHNETTGSLTGLDATSRLASGEGAQLWIEVSSSGTFSAGSNTFTLTYTNHAGTSGQVTQNIITTASQAAGRSVNSGITFHGLADGDRGIRSVQTFTAVSGSATGAMNICLVRVLLMVPIVSGAIAATRDAVAELIAMDRIFDDSCLSLLFYPQGAATPTFFGDIVVASN